MNHLIMITQGIELAILQVHRQSLTYMEVVQVIVYLKLTWGGHHTRSITMIIMAT